MLRKGRKLRILRKSKMFSGERSTKGLKGKRPAQFSLASKEDEKKDSKSKEHSESVKMAQIVEEMEKIASRGIL